MKWQEGKILEFKGVTWHEKGWEFDAPVIIYCPVKRYGFTGSISTIAIQRKIEDICIDLCIHNEVNDNFSPEDQEEFSWRGWDETTFPLIEGVHLSQKVLLDFEDGEKSYFYI